VTELATEQTALPAANQEAERQHVESEAQSDSQEASGGGEYDYGPPPLEEEQGGAAEPKKQTQRILDKTRNGAQYRVGMRR